MSYGYSDNILISVFIITVHGNNRGGNFVGETEKYHFFNRPRRSSIWSIPKQPWQINTDFKNHTIYDYGIYISKQRHGNEKIKFRFYVWQNYI